MSTLPFLACQKLYCLSSLAEGGLVDRLLANASGNLYASMMQNGDNVIPILEDVAQSHCLSLDWPDGWTVAFGRPTADSMMPTKDLLIHGTTVYLPMPLELSLVHHCLAPCEHVQTPAILKKMQDMKDRFEASWPDPLFPVQLPGPTVLFDADWGLVMDMLQPLAQAMSEQASWTESLGAFLTDPSTAIKLPDGVECVVQEDLDDDCCLSWNGSTYEIHLPGTIMEVPVAWGKPIGSSAPNPSVSILAECCPRCEAVFRHFEEAKIKTC